MTDKSYTVKTHPKLIKCIEEQLIDARFGLPFYGQFNLNMNFYESKTLPTCGVNVSTKGFNFFFNDDFLNELSQKEVNFVDIHELFHLLFNHPTRTILGNYDPYLSNVVQDMIINYIIWNDIDHNHVEIPKTRERFDKDGNSLNKNEVGNNMALFVPNDYEGPLIFEHLYNWMNKKRQEKKERDSKGGKPEECSNDGKSENSSSGGEGGTKNREYGPFGKKDKEGKEIDTYSLDNILDNIESKKGSWLDSHIEDEIPQDLKDSMVKDLTERLKARGFNKGGIDKILDKLQKKKKDYLSEIKRSIANDIAGRIKKETITRPSRRGIPGLKGNKKVQTVINCILDVSGSMSGLTEKVLNYIYRSDITINIIQCDAGVQKSETIRNMRQLQNMGLRGFGGTTLQPGIDLISEKFDKYNTVILTDGFTDKLSFQNIRGNVLIISAGVKCPITHDNGKVKQIIVEETK